MRGRRGTPDPGEPWLADLLRAEADRHEPDLEVVRRRLAGAPPPGAGAPGAPGAAGAAGAGGRVPGPRRGAAWAAAGFVVATAAGGIAVASMSDVLVADGRTGPVRVVVSDSPGPPAGQPPATGTGPGTPAGSAAPTPAAPAPPAPAPVTPPAATVPPAAPPATTRGTAPGTAPAAARLDVRAVGPGHVVSLTGARDWLVAGVRPDGIAVRSATGGQVLGGPHVVGDPTTAVADGPFRVSWRGGQPDATGSSTGRWLTVTGRDGGPRTGFVVAAPAGATSLTLCTGAGSPGARVTVRTAGRELDAAGLARGGHVVTVALSRYGGGPVEVLVDAPGGGQVALAAAVLR
jgi:hypothetical protein